jgi:aromatic-L-amino-acid decarboxylase
MVLAQEFVQWVKSDSRFELAAPAPLNLICFRQKAGDDANQTIMDRLNRSGDLYLTHTRLQDKLTLRVCIGQANTERQACGEGLEANSGRGGSAGALNFAA